MNRYTRFSGFSMRDSGNVVVKKRHLVTKSAKSFHFDLTRVEKTSKYFIVKVLFIALSPKNRMSCI